MTWILLHDTWHKLCRMTCTTFLLTFILSIVALFLWLRLRAALLLLLTSAMRLSISASLLFSSAKPDCRGSRSRGVARAETEASLSMASLKNMKYKMQRDSTGVNEVICSFNAATIQLTGNIAQSHGNKVMRLTWAHCLLPPYPWWRSSLSWAYSLHPQPNSPN